MTIEFKPVTLDSKNELNDIFESYSTESCEYNFNTLFLWNNLYESNYYRHEEFTIFLNRYHDKMYTMMPLCHREAYDKAFSTILSYFTKLNLKMEMYAVEKGFANYIEENYSDRFSIHEVRDSFDYIYEGNDLRTLKGKKFHQKRNHINSFMKEFGEKFEYKNLSSQHFDEVIDCLAQWQEEKEGDIGEKIRGEAKGIEALLLNLDRLDIKTAGIWIEGRLEAFTIGSYSKSRNQANIHIEKANSNIRGLYAFINKTFLNEEFPEVETVNREDDLGIEGIRKAKLSYQPIKLVEKYIIKEL